MRFLLRLSPVLALLAAFAIAYAMGLHDVLSWAGLSARQGEFQKYIMMYPFGAAAGFAGLYAAAVAVSFPGAVVLTVASGLLFGTVEGGALTVLGATTGSVLVFLIARSALAPLLFRAVGPALARFRQGLDGNTFSYVLALRLIPVFPFWMVNLAPALLGARLLPFAAATALGILPATFIYASLGTGIGGVLAGGGRPDLTVIFTPPVLLPLFGLAALALLPVGWRAWRKRDAV
jgi:uncharacterized membrane protein YdjX (TVP38/TMEM64 family)